MIRRLDWDSEFFGFEIAEWLSNEGMADDPSRFRLIYAKSISGQMPYIEGFENRFSEKKIMYSKFLQNKEVFCDGISTFSDNGKAGDLYELAYESGKYSRFRMDKDFGEHHFRKLYNAWIDNSISGLFADEVLVYKIDGIVAGMVTYKIHNDYASIGLIAVAPGQQGKGIGKRLLDCVEAKLLEKEIVELRIPTQESNAPACSFYEKRGYSVLETQYIMHYWKI